MPITAKDLKKAGFEEGKIMGLALKIANSFFTQKSKKEIVFTLKNVLENPLNFLENQSFSVLANQVIEYSKNKYENEIHLKPKGEKYSVFGVEHIEQGAIDQMNIAMKLPITVAGALMPDAHQGYGLPIGGVLATNGVVIPYGVGVDIGCRMALTVYDIPETHFIKSKEKFRRDLISHTKFGAGNGWQGMEKAEHELLDRTEFDLIPFIKNLKDKAWTQLGSSGGGNHFVEWGIVEFKKDDAPLNIKKGRYVALLSHSGSRGMGAAIAGHYTKIAKEIRPVPKKAANFAWLDLSKSEGQEYWMAMNLAGDYASACHEIIHKRITAATGSAILTKVENHHNFAWKETHRGQEVIVHRKGATPASKDVLGIIPGSMTASGFLVRGKGEVNSINSASHGAGRKMSRTQAIKNISKEDLQKKLEEKGVILIGAGLDEAPMAYKDIHKMMKAQSELVEIVAEFTPKIVRMADDGSRED